MKTVPFSLALSGTMRNYVFPNSPSLVESNVWGQALAADGMIPLLVYDGQDGPSLVLAGEFTVGSGYGDAFPNWNGGLPTFATAAATTSAYNGPNAPNLDPGIAGMNSGNFQLVQLQTWNGQLQFHFPKDWGTFITLGYGELFSPNIGAFTSGSYNDDYALFANLIHDFTANIRGALEYDRFDTHYLAGGGSEAVDQRVQLSSYYFF